MIISMDIVRKRYYVVSIKSILNHALFVEALSEYGAVSNSLINQMDIPLDEVKDKLHCIDCMNHMFMFDEIIIIVSRVIV